MSLSRSRPRSTPAARPRASALVFGPDACHDLPGALAREWLETDGLGGYAALTSLLCPTRRQHGLLVAPSPNHPRRHVFLQRFEETLHIAARSFPLSMARYPGLYSPHGHLTLDRFEVVPWPKSIHRVGDATVTREILMPAGSPTVLIRYEVEGAPGPVTLDLLPMLPFREADALTHENAALNPRTDVRRRDDRSVALRCRPYPELPAISITVGGADCRFDAAPLWYRRLEYPLDIARGYDGHEDCFTPGTLRITLARGAHASATVAATIAEPVADPVERFDEASRARRASWSAAGDGLAGLLSYGADRFLASAADGRPRVIAGFPWFLEWGRDTFVAVPGLYFARGRVEEGGDVLEGALRYLRDGLFPNRFGPSPDASDYRSADAPLWFALAVRRYEVAGGSLDRLRSVFLPAVRRVVLEMSRGNPIGSEDESGLFVVNDGASASTWMDAVVDGAPVTPRAGSPVEIAALWVFARQLLARLERQFGPRDAADAAQTLAHRSATAFLARFAAPGTRSIGDGWRDGRVDATIRPNMVIAAALEWSPLPVEVRRDIARAAEAELLTPRGLRTLAPRDAAYQPRYEGNVLSRDRAYHQGTVWPWLLGFYVEATLRAFGRARAVTTRLRALLDGLSPATQSFGIGHLAEVFDGDPPHRPGGTFAQAWSDAEVLRAYALLTPSADRGPS